MWTITDQQTTSRYVFAVLENAIGMSSSKGGVGKTTLTACLAVGAAGSGLETLVVDLDATGAMSRALGYEGDGGEHLADALLGRCDLAPTRDSRDHLSYVAGGRALDLAVAGVANALASGRTESLGALERTLRAVASDYDLIVIDSPPRELLIRRMMLTTVGNLVIPTEVDAASIDGIADLLGDIVEMHLEQIHVLGVAVCRIRAEAAGLAREIRAEIDDALGVGTCFTQMIRDAPVIARACRQLGVVPGEYEVLAAPHLSTQRRFWERGGAVTGLRWSEAGSRLATDWQNLVGEILQRWAAARGDQ